jgi:hypothetical protein
MGNLVEEEFIGRKNELAFLNRVYSEKGGQLVVLYGRRRVGKTQLLKQFCKDKPNVFYQCRKYTDEIQLKEFSAALLSYAKEDYLTPFSNWDNLFAYFKKLEGSQRLVIVIDEFPYACMANKSLPSVLQFAWDSFLSHLNIMVVLCGSSMSFIEDELLSEKNPLYGRATGIYKVLPMPYFDAAKFVPDFSDEDKLATISILGGIPQYLKQFDSTRSLKQNIIDKILLKGCSLYSEVEFLLYQELRETAVYNTIIQTIATGSTTFNEIMTKTQLEKSKLSVYLRKLIELNIVVKELPAGATPKQRAANGLYELNDNFFAFWFTFAYPNLGMLEMEDPLAVWDENVQKDLHQFCSRPFEKICMEYMYEMNKRKSLPFRFTNISRWWGKVTKQIDGKQQTTVEEIDILATDAKQENYILGECKYTNTPFDMTQLKKLRGKLALEGNVYYYLFSLNGFTQAVIDEANTSNNITLITPKDMFSI